MDFQALLSFSLGPQLHEIRGMPRWLRDKGEHKFSHSSHTEGVTGKL